MFNGFKRKKKIVTEDLALFTRQIAFKMTMAGWVALSERPGNLILKREGKMFRVTIEEMEDV